MAVISLGHRGWLEPRAASPPVQRGSRSAPRLFGRLDLRFALIRSRGRQLYLRMQIAPLPSPTRQQNRSPNDPDAGDKRGSDLRILSRPLHHRSQSDFLRQAPPIARTSSHSNAVYLFQDEQRFLPVYRDEESAGGQQALVEKKD